MAKILVADSCEGIRVLFSDYFAEHLKGHVVEFVRNGQEAIALFEQTNYDLVISGVTMSPINGIELVALIKTLSPKTPVVLMSGLKPPENHGADAFIQKPFSNGDAEKIFRHLLG